MAIDGVAPRAKMNQQRSRRFRTAKDAEDARRKAIQNGEELPPEPPFDTNCITPGTSFMIKLTQQLRYFISKKVQEDANWRNVEIVLSGPEVPGEGEHKIMEYIRLSKAQPDYDPNTRHCLYGLDADLLMLGLLSHDPHFALLREEVVFGKHQKKKVANVENQNFYLLHLCLMREYLDMEFSALKNTLSFGYDFERILDDFILLALFIGNDFLPNLPNLHINEGALGLIFKVYKEVLPTCGGYLQDGGHVEFSRLQKVLDQISAVVEKEAFEAENIDALYLAGKLPDGDNARELLHEIERKKATDRLSITEHQAEIFGKIRDFLVTPPKLNTESTLHFAFPLKSRDKKFLDKLTKELNMSYVYAWSQSHQMTEVELSFTHNLYADDTDDSPSTTSEESDVDEEAIAARDRVLKKYENAEIIPEEVSREQIEREEKAKFEAAFKQWKADYYKEKMDIDIDNQEQMDKLVSSYIIGIQWVLQYYYNGVASWSWFYPYHYAPKISDLKDIARFQDYSFTLGQPFKPYEQLMGVLPALSRKLLPAAYQDLMTDPDSPIIDFYPSDFDTDMNGKKQDWEAIVRIPFIDEQRLLDAMKQRESRLTKEEREMARFGESYKFVYDETLAKGDPKTWPVFKSPLPGKFPDVRPCFVRETQYHLPVLSSHGLRKGLLPGAKLGKEALAGFPSLHTIAHDFHIANHGVRVFQQDSTNESVVVYIKNRFKNASLRELAKLFIYRTVYVGYPYLKEAVVIGVSNAECKYHVSLDSNGGKHFLEHKWNDRERDDWYNTVSRHDHIRSKRFGLLIGETDILAHVCLLKGMCQNEEGALVKQYDHPTLAETIPFQTIVIKVANPDPRFIEKPAPPIQVSHPVGSHCFFTSGILAGTKVKVIGHGPHGINVQATKVRNPRFEHEPRFGYAIVNKQEKEITYQPAHVVARELNISSLTLAKLTSSLQVVERTGQKLNIGLNLKFESRGEKVPGYTRKNPSAGYWEYSTLAVQLIKEYTTTFPEFIEMLNNKKDNLMMDVSDFGWTNEGYKYLHKMKEWIKERKVHDLPRAPHSTEELQSDYVLMIEEAAKEYQQRYDKESRSKFIVKNTPRKNLLRPSDAPYKLINQSFALGDRVIYVTDTGAVPLGLKGTVVGVLDKVIDVVFDATFLGGTTLGGRCKETRGASLSYWQVYNLSGSSERSHRSR
ncbi:unnamed protein product [Rhizopus microsporus]